MADVLEKLKKANAVKRRIIDALEKSNPFENAKDYCSICSQKEGDIVYREDCICPVECPKCEGKGEYDEIDHSQVNSTTIDPPLKSVWCEECNGVGEIIPTRS